MTTTLTHPKYRIFAENCRNKTLIIEILGKNVFLTRTAAQILEDELLLKEFDGKEATAIACMAEMDNSK